MTAAEDLAYRYLALWQDYVTTMPEAVQHWEDLMPCGRLGDPREVANAMVWLASDEASYVSGIVLPVDHAASVA